MAYRAAIALASKTVPPKEKFIEVYNQFITKRLRGKTVTMLQAAVKELQRDERDLAELRLQRLIPETSFREEQRQSKQRLQNSTCK